jgi:hypothetical protein
MTHVPYSKEPARKAPDRGHRLLFAGVGAAALMGVGLGLWARPAMSERQLAAPVAKVAPAPIRLLQIVVEDGPAPLGTPIEVLPALPEAAKPVLAPERAPSEARAPVRPPTGLLRVQAVEQAPARAEPEAEPAPKPKPKPKPKPRVAPRQQPPLAVKQVVKAASVARSKPAIKVKAVAKVEAPKAKPVRLEKVRVAAKPKPVKVELAKAQPKSPKAKVQLAKLERPAKARLEKARAHKPAKVRELAQAFARAGVHKAEPAAKLQKAKAERRQAKPAKAVSLAKPAKPQLQKAAVKVRPAKAEPIRPLRPARGAGPVRVAKAAPRSEAVIRDADKQMYRAYSSARAAGVPDWQLRRQQQRWEQARASAAREAPWAVRDVYLARIAELHDLTRDADAAGY